MADFLSRSDKEPASVAEIVVRAAEKAGMKVRHRVQGDLYPEEPLDEGDAVTLFNVLKVETVVGKKQVRVKPGVLMEGREDSTRAHVAAALERSLLTRARHKITTLRLMKDILDKESTEEQAVNEINSSPTPTTMDPTPLRAELRELYKGCHVTEGLLEDGAIEARQGEYVKRGTNR